MEITRSPHDYPAPTFSLVPIYYVLQGKGKLKRTFHPSTTRLTINMHTHTPLFLLPLIFFPAPPPSSSVYAEYTIKSPNSLAVHNYANERGVNDIIHDAQLCALINDPAGDPGRLAVGPCLFFFEFLEQFIYGPYFIVAYDEAEGYALVSGGSPTVPTKDGLCTTQRGFNNAGLWVFSRSNVRNEALIQKVRGIAVSKGFDVDVLEDVQHVGCKYQPSSAPRSLRAEAE